MADLMAGDAGGAGAGGDSGGQAAAGSDAGGAGATEHWTTSLPEGLRDSGSLKRYESAEAAHRGYLDLEKKMAGNPDTLLHIPQDDDSEGWSKLFSKLGRPDSHEKYTFPKPENTDPDDIDEIMESQLAQGFHAANLTVKQAEQLYNVLMSADEDQLTRLKGEVQKKNDASTAALKAEWGPDYEKNLGLSQRAFGLFPERLQTLVAESGFTGDIDYIKVFHKFGQFLGEDGTAGGAGGTGGFGGMSKETADVKLAEFRGDKEKIAALTDPKSLGHQAAKAEWEALNLAKVGGEAIPIG